MNSLTTTRMFTYMEKLYKLTDIIGNPNFDIDKYVIDYNQYEHFINFIKGYRFPLSKKVIDAIIKEEVKPILFAEPKDPNQKTIIFPQSIPGFIKRTTKGLVSYVDLSARAEYIRHKQTKEIELFKTSERDFYSFMQTAFLNKFCHVNEASLSFNVKFTKLIAESYAFMLFKCITSTYPIAANKNSSEILIFLCAVFAFQNFFEYDLQKATSLALTLRGITKVNIMNNCQFYIRLNDEFDMRPSTLRNRKGVDEKGKEIRIFSIDILLAILAEEFPVLKSGKLEYRNLVQRFTTMYGANSVLAIEHFMSFLTMMEMSHMKIGYYNDMGVDNACGVYVSELNTLLSTL